MKSNNVELLKRLDADCFAGKVFFTQLGTVVMKKECLTWKRYNFSELLIDDFLKLINEDIDNAESLVKYDTDNNKFYLIYRKHDVIELDINEEIMKDYCFGKYDNLTSKIHNLYLKSMSMEEKRKLCEKQQEEKNIQLGKIIEKINTTHEVLTPAEARVYLDYLEELKNTNIKIIRGCVTSFLITVIAPITVSVGTLSSILGILVDMPIVGTLCCDFVYAFLTTIIIDLRLDNKRKHRPRYFHAFAAITEFIKDSFKTIKVKMKENKIIEMKSINLRKIEKVDKMVIAKSYSIEEFDKTLEDEKALEQLNLKNEIIKSLDDIVNRISLLNVSDKKELLLDAQRILTQYTERYTSIVNQDDNIIDLDADSFIKLKIDILTEIASLEEKVNDARQREVKIKMVVDESKLLTDKIEVFGELNLMDFEMKKMHGEEREEVMVKKLKV